MPTLELQEGCTLSVLKKRAQFLAIAGSGKKWVTPHFVLQLGPAIIETPSEIFFGLTASAKVGNAVKRNRCRRRLRSLAREILPVQASPQFSYVLVARGTAFAADYAALKKDLLWALKRSGALRGRSEKHDER